MYREKVTLLALAAILGLAAGAHAAITVNFNQGNDVDAGGDGLNLADIDNGDTFGFKTGDFLGANGHFTDGQANAFNMTFTEGANTVTLRMHIDIVGDVQGSGGTTDISQGDSITIYFEVVSGALDAISLDSFRSRALTSNTDGKAGEGMSMTDNLGTKNTFYGIQIANSNPQWIGTTNGEVSSDSTYQTLVIPNPAPEDMDAGLTVLSAANIGAWSWTYAGEAPGIDGRNSKFSLNSMSFTVTPGVAPRITGTSLVSPTRLRIVFQSLPDTLHEVKSSSDLMSSPFTGDVTPAVNGLTTDGSGNGFVEIDITLPGSLFYQIQLP